MTNTTLTTRPGASPEITTPQCGSMAVHEDGMDGGTPTPDGARRPVFGRGRHIRLSVSLAWALSVTVVGAIGAAYLMGRAAGVIDGYWQCAGELGVVG